MPIAEIAAKLGIPNLKRAGGESVGPCPVCGGRDRFSINPQRNVFNCRGSCGGGDVLKLVQLVLGCDFPAALSWVAGERPVEIDPEELRRRRERAAAQAEKQAARAERERQRSIAAARTIWCEGLSAEDSPVRGYMELRGISRALLPELPRALRFHPALPYMVPGDRAGEWVEVHRGPAMLAAVMSPRDAVAGVHRTWIDLDRPKGKARITHKGEDLAAKKTLGSIKGGAIRLQLRPPARLMVMGEGIETTLTACVADDRPHTAFWAGVSLGNMAGRRILRGTGMKYAGVPDLTDETAFIPPPWVEHLVFIQDGDSEPRATRAQLVAGLRRARAMVPGVARISIVHAGEGRDLNDILIDEGEA